MSPFPAHGSIANKVLLETDMVNDNYFYSGYFLGFYQEHNCPRCTILSGAE